MPEQTFRGPAGSFQLDSTPADGTVTVARNGQTVDTTVDGTTVRRTTGYFGAGRWTATYDLPTDVGTPEPPHPWELSRPEEDTP